MTVTQYQSQVVAFVRYATAQVAYHKRVLALHQLDGTGCCRFCGRVWPCDQARHSRRMVDHFSQWALDSDAGQSPQAGTLVRPYARPT
jgi:hypothetical protein